VINLSVQEQVRAFEGLSDGGHIIVACSSCKAGLLDIWVTRPNEIDPGTGKPFHWKVRANCPFCEDKSFIVEFDGGYHVGGVGTLKEGGEDTDPSTIWTDFDEANGVLNYLVKKASPDAKPSK